MKLKKLLCLLMALLMLLGLALPAAAANDQVTILFTHDLHSHLLPANDEMGNSYGGYARLMTAIKQQKELHPDALLVDGGDFSMGSLFQTVYATDAAELRIMGAMGYDATTFGNHEFDYRPKGFADMLNTAANCGETLLGIGPEVFDRSLFVRQAQLGIGQSGILPVQLLYSVGYRIYSFKLTLGVCTENLAENSHKICLS